VNKKGLHCGVKVPKLRTVKGVRAKVVRHQRRKNKAKPHSRRFAVVGTIFAFLIILGAVGFAFPNLSRKTWIAFTQSLGLAPKPPRNLAELLALKPADLESVDLALMNLLCAQGLPGSGDLNVPHDLATLDRWAERVESETKKYFHKFRENPAEYNSSEGYFRVLVLITVLQQDFKVRYNPAHITDPTSPEPDSLFFTDSKDLFLNGLACPRAMGTCISMPVLYVAVGRRLGYPMKLVTTREHLFARWEGGKERFNIEATGQGLSTFDDDYYKTWPFPLTEVEVRSGQYLKSLAPAEELSLFLETRGHCLRVAGDLGQARTAYLQAQKLAPQWPEHQVFLALIDRMMIPPAAARPLSHSEIDALAAEVEAVNQQNRRAMEIQQQRPGQIMRPTAMPNGQNAIKP
jgi:hypothetical protein